MFKIFKTSKKIRKGYYELFVKIKFVIYILLTLIKVSSYTSFVTYCIYHVTVSFKKIFTMSVRMVKRDLKKKTYFCWFPQISRCLRRTKYSFYFSENYKWILVTLTKVFFMTPNQLNGVFCVKSWVLHQDPFSINDFYHSLKI